jgi:hypothetical protein
MKKSSDTIGNRTRDLPVCSAVPQPLRHRVPHRMATGVLKYLVISVALRDLVTSFYFSLYNGLYNDFNVIASVKCVCVCMCVCACVQLEAEKAGVRRLAW